MRLNPVHIQFGWFHFICEYVIMLVRQMTKSIFSLSNGDPKTVHAALAVMSETAVNENPLVLTFLNTILVDAAYPERSIDIITAGDDENGSPNSIL